MAFSPLRPWRHRHIAHKTISYRLRGPQPGDLFLLPPQPQGGTSKPQCPHGRVGPRPTPRGRSERRRPWPELPPTLLSVVRPRPCAARPMPPLSSRRRFVYSGAIQCPKASITPQLRYRLHPAPLNRFRVLHPVTNLVTKSRLHIWQESLPLLALPAPRICIILRSDQTLTQNLIPPYPDKHPLKCPYYVRIYLNER